MPEPTTERGTAEPTADEGVPKVGGWTYALAVTWAGTLIAMAWVVPAFRAIYREMGYEGLHVLPITIRAVVGAPMAAWIASGLLAGGAVILKSKLLPAKDAVLVNVMALLLYGIFVGLVVITVFRPLVDISSDPTVWPRWLPF